MRPSCMAAGLILGLAVGSSGFAFAAGQPQLPESSNGQSAQERMETKRAIDPQKYEKPHGGSTSLHQAAPSPKSAAQANAGAVHPGGVGRSPTPGSESTGTEQASPSQAQAPQATPGAVEGQHGSSQTR